MKLVADRPLKLVADQQLTDIVKYKVANKITFDVLAKAYSLLYATNNPSRTRCNNFDKNDIRTLHALSHIELKIKAL